MTEAVVKVFPGRCGWGWPGNSNRAHYFIEARSLCAKWLFMGAVKEEGAENKGPDDCAECRRRYDRERAKRLAYVSPSPPEKQPR